MSTPDAVEDAVRELMLVLPRLIGQLKRLPPPEPLRALDLTARHRSLLSMLVHDGPLTVSELAARLSVAPTTVSLVVSELHRKQVLVRRTDEADRRRHIIEIDEDVRPDVARWLSPGHRAWRQALAPLDAEQRRLVVDTLLAFEAAFADALERDPG